MKPDSPNRTVGLLFPGEMGTAIGKSLLARGMRVVTSLDGRGSNTRSNCVAAGFEQLESMDQVSRESDFVLSIVSPSAALPVAMSYASNVPKDGRRRTYADLNSISPETAIEIGSLLNSAGVEFVDGAVHGLAAQLENRGRVYLSGPRAGDVAALFESVPYVRIVGATPGAASALRMLVSGLTKGVIALFTEMALAAHKGDLLEELMECYSETYPGVMDIVGRILPTYPTHARRRGDEMKEVEQMLRGFGMDPCLAHATQQLIEQMGRIGLEANSLVPKPEFGNEGANDQRIREIVKECSRRGLLQGDSVVPKEENVNERGAHVSLVPK